MLTSCRLKPQAAGQLSVTVAETSSGSAAQRLHDAATVRPRGAQCACSSDQNIATLNPYNDLPYEPRLAFVSLTNYRNCIRRNFNTAWSL